MNNKIKNFIGFFTITLLVFILHVLATRMSFYYIFWWYDSLLHILAGMAVAFFGLIFISRRKPLIIPALATLVGILWEIFERLGHVWWPNYVGFGGTWDTVFDVLCAILGSLIIIAFQFSWQKNNITHT